MNGNYIQNVLNIPWVKKERDNVVKFTLLFEKIGRENINLFMKNLFDNLTKEEQVKLMYDIESTVYVRRDKITTEADIYIESKKNITSKPNELLLDFGKTVSCEYTKAYVLDNKFIRAHEDGSIYIHNLDYFNLGSLSSTHLEPT